MRHQRLGPLPDLKEKTMSTHKESNEAQPEGLASLTMAQALEEIRGTDLRFVSGGKPNPGAAGAAARPPNRGPQIPIHSPGGISGPRPRPRPRRPLGGRP